MTSTRPPDPCPEDHVQNVARAVLDELGAMILDAARQAGAPLPHGDPGLLWWHTPNEALQRGGLLYGSLQVGQGVKAGIEDLTIDEAPPARPDAKGVRIELKKVGGTVSPDQKRILAAHQRRGYLAFVAKGTFALLDLLRELGWDVDEALRRLAARGERVLPDGRLDVKPIPFRPGQRVRVTRDWEWLGESVVESVSAVDVRVSGRTEVFSARTGFERADENRARIQLAA